MVTAVAVLALCWELPLKNPKQTQAFVQLSILSGGGQSSHPSAGSTQAAPFVENALMNFSIAFTKPATIMESSGPGSGICDFEIFG